MVSSSSSSSSLPILVLSIFAKEGRSLVQYHFPKRTFVRQRQHLVRNRFRLNTISSRRMSSGGDNPPFVKYVPGMDVGELEFWPFDNPKSNYVIHDNTQPKAYGRIDHSTSTTRMGIWKCTIGKMECTEQGDELMTILQGKVEVTDVNSGQVVLLTPGDSMYSYDGKRVVWNVLEDVIKVFYGFKADGY